MKRARATGPAGDISQVFCRGIATPRSMLRSASRWRMHYPVILRCTGASEGWLSPSNGQDTCYFGFVVYYAADGSLSEEGNSFLRAVERALAEEGGRPHWGKYFDESLYD